MSEQKRGMTTVNWVFLTIILALIQAFIWYAAFENSESPNALNYVSFAGTLISIILAVLAIGYTYGESVIEKNKGDKIHAQVESLEKVIQEAKVESDKLEKISEILNRVNSLESDLGNKIENTKDGISKEIGTLIDSFSNTDISTNNKKVPAKIVIDIAERKRHPLILTSLVSILTYHDKSSADGVVGFGRELHNRYEDYSSDFKNKKDEVIDDETISFYISSALTLYVFLEGLGLISKKDSGIQIDKELDSYIRSKIVECFEPEFDDVKYIYSRMIDDLNN